MYKIIYMVCFILCCFKVLAMNVIPDCTDVSFLEKSRIYNNYTEDGLIFYTNGQSHNLVYLSKGQCLIGEEPGVFKTVLVLKQDGNLINYLYDEQNDNTYAAFSSNTPSKNISSALFYLDFNSDFHNIIINLMDNNNSLVTNILPLPTKKSNKTLNGSLRLANIAPNGAVQGLAVYNAVNGELYQYPYDVHLLKYIDIYFDNHTLETRDAEYLITIHDQWTDNQKPVIRCVFPFTGGDCYGKIKYVEPNHYVAYIEDNMKIEIAKLLKNDQSKRSIYLDENGNVFFGWNDSNAYILPFDMNYWLSDRITYIWIPSYNNYRTLHLLSWDDSPTVPDGDYKETCDMSSMRFSSGILTGYCSYIDSNGIIHWVSSSLNYDQLCKKDPAENDLVTNKMGNLVCK